MFSWKIASRSAIPLALKDDASTTIIYSPERNNSTHPTPSLCSRPRTGASAGQGRAERAPSAREVFP